MTPTRTPTKLARLLGVALVATSALGSASVWAESRYVTTDMSRAQAATLNFYSNAGAASNATPTRIEGPIYAGSYKLDNGDWVYCLSPLTTVGTGPGSVHTFNKVSLATFLATGGGYEQQFALNPLYAGVASGYDNQANAGNLAVAGSVINKIVTLYDYAYANTQSGTAAGADWAAAFAYALWEIEGEGSGYSSTTGGLRLSGATSAVVADASTLLGNLNSGNWSGFTRSYYNFNVYQADPIESSQSFLVVTAPTHPGTNDIGISVPEPSTGLLVAASALAFLGSRRAARGKPAA